MIHTGTSSERPSCSIVIDVALLELIRFSGRRRDQRGVVPRQLGHRLGQFLHPAVVREASVVDRRVAPEIDLDAVVRRRLSGDARRHIRRDGRRRCAGNRRRARDEAVVEPFAPQRFEGSGAVVRGAAGAPGAPGAAGAPVLLPESPVRLRAPCAPVHLRTCAPAPAHLLCQYSRTMS